MSEPTGEATTPSIRIGTAERNAAMAALDAHLEAGRLDPVEYGERSARVVDARTADDLRPLFVDLPAPHPDLPGSDVRSGTPGTPGTSAPPATREAAPPATRQPAAMEVWGPRIAAVMPFVALVLYLSVPVANSWLFFLLIPAAGALFARSRGDDDDRRRRHRERGEDRRRS